MTDTYVRARLSILSQLMSYPQIGGKDWADDRSPKKGELVAIRSAPDSKWYLSWFEDIEPHESGFSTRYLLKSIEDHEPCWWSNIGIAVYRPRNSSCWPHWKWTDRQFAFNDRWKKVCFKWNDAYLVKPHNAEFGEGHRVTLKLYRRHDFENKWSFEKTFPDWRKVTMKTMDELYKEAIRDD